MKELSKDTMAEIDIEREKEEFAKSVDVRILDSTDGVSRFSAIVDSRRGIIIK